jgi:multidrug efflux pump
MISRFFIDRPIFATVLSIIMMLTGGISLMYLPVAQYPRITPPGVSITISYPGASAQEVADTVGAPIEQQVNGIDRMLYMSSQSGNDGSYTLTVTFDIGTDLKSALVMVQNRIALAMPQLPTPAQNQGITIRKRTPDMLMIVNFIDPTGHHDDIWLSNFATINCKDELLRVPGVSDLTIQGQRDYSMRIWLDPQKLASRNMTAIDVANAVRSENADAPAGRIGQPPVPAGQTFQYPLNTLGRLNQIKQFEDIIVKVGGKPLLMTPDGKVIEPAVAAPKMAQTPAAAASSSTLGNPTVNSLLIGPVNNVTTTDIVPPASTSSGGGGAAPGSAGGSSAAPTAQANSSDTSTDTAITPIPTSVNPLASASSGNTPTQANSLLSTNAPAGGTVGSGSLSGGTLGTGPPSPSSAIVRLRDVARIEVGAQNYNTICTLDGGLSVGFGLYQLPGTNALEVADAVRAKMEEMKKGWPEGVDYKIAYDTSLFVRDSVNDVKKTLFDAVLLVAVVVLVFLQSWRAAMIPLIAVPVAIIGTFSIMALLGFSLNNISLFGLVLAIGIVVDDAIVVVENVERWMEKGYDAREASRRAMDEVTGPIVAVGLVLCAVFVPCAFIAGITGQFFRQFAVTIAVSTIISTINSLTFSPAMTAIFLKPHHNRRDPLTMLMNLALGWFFWCFNKVFNASTAAYAWSVGKLMRLYAVVLLVFFGLFFLAITEFRKAPTGFIPQQDQGRLIVNVQLTDAASLERTEETMKKVVEIAMNTPGVHHVVANGGLSFLLQANSPNFGAMFIVLKPFAERQKPGLRDVDIMDNLRREWNKLKTLDGGRYDCQVTVFGASPIPGLGTAGGFKFLVEDRGGLGVRALEDQMNGLIAKLKKIHGLKGVSTQFRANIPTYFLDLGDRKKIFDKGVSLDDVNQTLNILEGSVYVNSYNDFGRHWQVTLQADGNFRNNIADLNLFSVRNSTGSMVPLGTLMDVKERGGPISVTRYKLYTSAVVTGNIDLGTSSGEVIDEIDKECNDFLPLSMRTEWTELMYLQILAGNTAIYVFILAVICVFLALSALYESWSLPLAVILVVPLCLLCSVEGVRWTNRDVNIFVQIGLVVLVGLACKNAILIVEFSKQLHDEGGRTVFDATKEASRLRLRPILMTSFAFIFGVLPLVFATGAGAEMRGSLGVAVFSGMLGVTIFGIFLTPVFFFVIQGLSETKMFGARMTRTVLSYLWAGTLGGTIGFSLARVGIGVLPWGPLIGIAGGMLVIRAILAIRQIIPRNGQK